MSPKISFVQESAKYNLRVRVLPRVYINYPARTITDAREFRKVCIEKMPGTRLKFQLFKSDTLIKF